MKPFELTCPLITPVIIQAPLTLDALLAAALYHKTGDPEGAISEIPLKQSSGLFHGSTIQLERAVPGDDPAADVARFDVGFVKAPGKPSDLYSILPVASQPWSRDNGIKNAISYYSCWAVEKVVFYGCGDPDKVKRLIKALPGIGKKTSHGYGQIDHANVRIEELDEDISIADEGVAMRPIPERLAHMFGSPAGIRHLATWRPPYWSDEKEACIGPVRPVVMNQGGTIEVLAERLGPNRSGESLMNVHENLNLAERKTLRVEDIITALKMTQEEAAAFLNDTPQQVHIVLSVLANTGARCYVIINSAYIAHWFARAMVEAGLEITPETLLINIVDHGRMLLDKLPLNSLARHHVAKMVLGQDFSFDKESLLLTFVLQRINEETYQDGQVGRPMLG